MIDTTTKDYALAIIDLQEGIVSNSTDLVESACSALNAQELDHDATTQVNDIIYQFCYQGEDVSSVDLLEYTINTLDCIKDKKYLVSLSEILRLSAEKSKEEQKEWLENLDLSTIDFSSDIDQSFYIKLLLQFCMAHRMYEKSEEIRNLLKEVK